jgi:hypothetical protein
MSFSGHLSPKLRSFSVKVFGRFLGSGLMLMRGQNLAPFYRLAGRQAANPKLAGARGFCDVRGMSTCSEGADAVEAIWRGTARPSS